MARNGVKVAAPTNCASSFENFSASGSRFVLVTVTNRIYDVRMVVHRNNDEVLNSSQQNEIAVYDSRTSGCYPP
jgi:hypothetical protein